jgi:site-specific recombinase XerD
LRFDRKLATPFIYKSVSEETRRAYLRVIHKFFAFVKGAYPTAVTPRNVLEFQEYLMRNRKQRVRTVSFKLAVIRSFFEYLKAAGLNLRRRASARKSI